MSRLIVPLNFPAMFHSSGWDFPLARNARGFAGALRCGRGWSVNCTDAPVRSAGVVRSVPSFGSSLADRQRKRDAQPHIPSFGAVFRTELPIALQIDVAFLLADREEVADLRT